jgi:purine-cytosine permease-like protein
VPRRRGQKELVLEPFGLRGIPDTGIDRVGQIETRGVEPIPDAERHSRPLNLFFIFIGLELTFGVIVVGWIPIAFGLGWWSSVTAILAGVAVGSLVLGPMALLGRATATNGAVSSGAFFGVVGRIVGSVLALLIAIGFYALTVWTAGQVAVEGAHRLIGTPNSDALLAVGYAVVAAVTVVIAVFGHANVLAANKLMIPTSGILLIVGFFAFGSQFDAGYNGGAYLLGGFWPTWILAAVSTGAVAVEYGPFVNDYSRYVSPKRWSSRSVVAAVAAGSFVGLSFAFIFGAFTASTFTDVASPYAQGLVAESPTWYLVPLMIIAVLGSFGQGGTALYGTGLDFSSLIPVLRRVPATLVLSAIGVIFIYLGTFVFDAVDTVNAFILILLALTAPWVAINLIGYWQRGGYLSTDAVQVFNRGEHGGIYWFNHGANWRALLPWGIGSGVGLLFVNTTSYVGPFADAFGGVDLSFILAAVTASALYLLFLVLFPEPLDVYPEHAPGLTLTRRAGEATVPAAPDAGASLPVATFDTDAVGRETV